ncbi:hypothetical protein [Burkholderia sp. IDO3]|uniref:hypothetical protein n=1 Tax=Burkholderia sp. IDO3 TaxID=1705310 RepID=UPI001177BCDA|nr:hypothetical protein [Burkholderia sp. IDO3]
MAARARAAPRFPGPSHIDSVQCPERKSAIQKVFDGFKNSHWRRQMRAESPMKTDEIIMTASMANEADGVPERPPTIAVRDVPAPFRAPAGCRRR